MRRLLATGVILGTLALGLFTAPTTAQAEEAKPAASAAGVVRLFENPDFTGPSFAVTYATCNVIRATRITVGSFDNRPPAGCEVVLMKGGSTFELCAGRGTVPTFFRDAPTIRIQAGSSTPCAWVRAA